MSRSQSGSALSAHILKALCKNIHRCEKIRKISGQSVPNPLPSNHFNYSSIFNVNSRKYSAEASKDQKTPADNNNNNNPIVSDASIPPSERVLRLVDDIAGLTLNEVTDLTDVLRMKFDIKEMPIMTMMMPGMGMPIMPGDGAKAGAEAKPEEKQAAKNFFDLKLESFEAASKIKVIKEVRTFTDLGLKEAKELVEKTPGLLKKGVSKEEAEQIIAKMKDLGAKVVME
ncbi:hypothetical protein SUGI_0917230 [Cryptomeria japonica]|uniref:uncharacterized protein LOC131034478 n=1 Tax=Cryptomeria japonica TaxID=3369 RepID=UPI0024149697|nr:uncharacterized protein LOC131034478 [Cryptomeria japonica]GLJ43999.1 hypothetical protein SUGI_0917230 [Cryptomeria japonica]